MKMISKPYQVIYGSTKEWACLVQLDEGTKLVLNITEEDAEFFLISPDSAGIELRYPSKNKLMPKDKIIELRKIIDQPDKIRWNKGEEEFIQLNRPSEYNDKWEIQ